MFIAMNRFKIKSGCEQDFIDIWKNRDTYLDSVPGFQSFQLLQGAKQEEHTLFASHSIWENEQAFENWTKSEAFRKGCNPSPSRHPTSFKDINEASLAALTG